MTKEFEKYVKEVDVIGDLIMEIYEDLYKSKAGNKTAARRVRTNLIKLTNIGVAFRRLSIKSMQKKNYTMGR